jgi:hypothetical protein
VPAKNTLKHRLLLSAVLRKRPALETEKPLTNDATAPIANSSDVTLLFQTPVVTPFLQNHLSDSPCPQHRALTTLTTSSAFQDPISLQAHLLPSQLSRACVLTLLPSSPRSSLSSPPPTHSPPTTSSPHCPPAGRPVSRASSPIAPTRMQRTPLLYVRCPIHEP